MPKESQVLREFRIRMPEWRPSMESWKCLEETPTGAAKRFSEINVLPQNSDEITPSCLLSGTNLDVTDDSGKMWTIWVKAIVTEILVRDDTLIYNKN